MAFDWNAATAFAMTLPGTSMETFYADVVPKVRGKAFLSRSLEAGSFAIPCGTLDKAEMLKEVDPAVFWQSAHYQGWPWILVREDIADPETVMGLIESAWDMRASKAQRAERDATRP